MNALLEGKIDFEGQKLTDQLTLLFLSVTAISAFGFGYARESVLELLYVFMGGVILTFVVCVPPWPSFNRHPIAWLAPAEKKKEEKSQ